MAWPFDDCGGSIGACVTNALDAIEDRARSAVGLDNDAPPPPTREAVEAAGGVWDEAQAAAAEEARRAHEEAQRPIGARIVDRVIGGTARGLADYAATIAIVVLVLVLVAAGLAAYFLWWRR